jgi:hypothetical protein
MKFSHILAVMMLLGTMDQSNVVNANVEIEEIEEKDAS